MKTKLRFLGLDVHKLTITIAVAEEGDGVLPPSTVGIYAAFARQLPTGPIR